MTQKKFEKDGQKSSESENIRQYNKIYEKIVIEPDDAIGLVAYGLYKQKKIEYIKSVREKEDRDISDIEREHFHDFSCQHVDEYRDHASQLMQNVFFEVYEDVIKEAQESFDDTLKERLKGTLRSGVLASVLGSFATAILIGMLYLGYVGSRIGLEGLGRAVAGITAPEEFIKPPCIPDFKYTKKTTEN
ncbi:MAG: hypothetical protein MI749_11850 [Desulfovibrionales bacterium]|nr:hypothetical protein [Desulfovibrionales bacterium]